MVDLPTFEDVIRAKDRIAEHVTTTPVVRAPALDERAGLELFLKAENLQRIGAFKARGAMNAVLSIPEEQRRRGLVTYSSGNHGQAVALAGKQLGAPVHVVMPEDAPNVKVDSVRALGGVVTFAGTTSDDRLRVAKGIIAETGATMIPPFDDARVIAGQGTATLELLEVTRAMGVVLDAVLVPVGGGGLLAGACLAASGFDPAPAIIAVEPEAADAFKRSFEAKERVTIGMRPTLADGLRPVRVGELTFEIARHRVAAALTVTEEAIGRAVIALLLEAKILAEPSGATALAAALERALPPNLSPRPDGPNLMRVGVILSGGNVAPEVLVRLLEGATSPRP